MRPARGPLPAPSALPLRGLDSLGARPSPLPGRARGRPREWKELRSVEPDQLRLKSVWPGPRANGEIAPEGPVAAAARPGARVVVAACAAFQAGRPERPASCLAQPARPRPLVSSPSARGSVVRPPGRRGGAGGRGAGAGVSYGL